MRQSPLNQQDRHRDHHGTVAACTRPPPRAERTGGHTSSSFIHRESPIDNSFQMKSQFSPRDFHWGKKLNIGCMPSSRYQQETNSAASLEVPCHIMSCQKPSFFKKKNFYLLFYFIYVYFFFSILTLQVLEYILQLPCQCFYESPWYVNEWFGFYAFFQAFFFLFVCFVQF